MNSSLQPPSVRPETRAAAPDSEAERTGAAAAAAAGAAAAAAYERCSVDRKLALAASGFHVATQLVLLVSNYQTQTASEVVQRVTSVAYGLVLWALPFFAPVFYLRWRQFLLIAIRVHFFNHPLRNSQGVQRVLESEPQGLLKDLVKVIWDVRFFAVTVSALIAPLPMLRLVPHLLLQAYCVMRVRSNPTLCAAPLLAHPLTARRIHAFHAALRLLGMMLPGGSVGSAGFPPLPPPSGVGGEQQQQQQQECEAFITFVGVVASLVLPMALLVATEPTSALAEWELKRDPAAAAAAAGPAGPVAKRFRRLRAAAGGASAALEGAVRQLCGRSWLAPPEDGLLMGDEGAAEGGAAAAVGRAPHWQLRSALRLDGWTRGLAWWLLLSFLWGASVATAA